MRKSLNILTITITILLLLLLNTYAKKPPEQEAAKDNDLAKLFDPYVSYGEIEEIIKRFVKQKDMNDLKEILKKRDTNITIMLLKEINESKNEKDYVLLVPDIINIFETLCHPLVSGSEHVAIVMSIRKESFRFLSKITEVKYLNNIKDSDLDDIKIWEKVIIKTKKWWNANKKRILKKEAEKDAKAKKESN